MMEYNEVIARQLNDLNYQIDQLNQQLKDLKEQNEILRDMLQQIMLFNLQQEVVDQRKDLIEF